MFDEPPSVKRPTWKADTTVDPYEKVSGSTSVRCRLVLFVYGSVLTWVRATLATAAAAPTSVATATTRQAAAERSGKRVTPGSVADRTGRGNGQYPDISPSHCTLRTRCSFL